MGGVRFGPSCAAPPNRSNHDQSLLFPDLINQPFGPAVRFDFVMIFWSGELESRGMGHHAALGQGFFEQSAGIAVKSMPLFPGAV